MSTLPSVTASKRLAVLQVSTLAATVFHNDTYLSLFCSFLDLKNVLVSVNTLSNYHSKFVYQFKNTKLLETLLIYRFNNEKISPLFRNITKSEYDPKNIIKNTCFDYQSSKEIFNLNNLVEFYLFKNSELIIYLMPRVEPIEYNHSDRNIVIHSCDLNYYHFDKLLKWFCVNDKISLDVYLELIVELVVRSKMNHLKLLIEEYNELGETPNILEYPELSKTFIRLALGLLDIERDDKWKLSIGKSKSSNLGYLLISQTDFYESWTYNEILDALATLTSEKIKIIKLVKKSLKIKVPSIYKNKFNTNFIFYFSQMGHNHLGQNCFNWDVKDKINVINKIHELFF